jgi:hypothetical protein
MRTLAVIGARQMTRDSKSEERLNTNTEDEDGKSDFVDNITCN